MVLRDVARLQPETDIRCARVSELAFMIEAHVLCRFLLGHAREHIEARVGVLSRGNGPLTAVLRLLLHTTLGLGVRWQARPRAPSARRARTRVKVRRECVCGAAPFSPHVITFADIHSIRVYVYTCWCVVSCQWAPHRGAAAGV